MVALRARVDGCPCQNRRAVLPDAADVLRRQREVCGRHVVLLLRDDVRVDIAAAGRNVVVQEADRWRVNLFGASSSR